MPPIAKDRSDTLENTDENNRSPPRKKLECVPMVVVLEGERGNLAVLSLTISSDSGSINATQPKLMRLSHQDGKQEEPTEAPVSRVLSSLSSAEGVDVEC